MIDIERLKPFDLFNGLSDDQFRQVSNVMRTREIKRDNNIIVEGEMGDELYLLLKGEIVITKQLVLFDSGQADTKEKSLITLKDIYNVFIGEMSLFGDDKRSATVTALTDVTVGILTRLQVNRLSKADPSLGYHLFYNIGQKITANLRKANKDILKLTTAFCMALEGK
jgi:CRP/FNR family transcriptional regulator, cyclic AMP receptor protein